MSPALFRDHHLMTSPGHLTQQLPPPPLASTTTATSMPAKEYFHAAMHNRGPFMAHRRTHSPIARDSRSPLATAARVNSPTHRLSPRSAPGIARDVISPRSSHVPMHFPPLPTSASAANPRDQMTAMTTSSALSPSAASQSVALKANVPAAGVTMTSSVPGASATPPGSTLPHPPPLVSLTTTAVSTTQPPAVVASTYSSSNRAAGMMTQSQYEQQLGVDAASLTSSAAGSSSSASAPNQLLPRQAALKAEPAHIKQEVTDESSLPPSVDQSATSRPGSRSPVKPEQLSPTVDESDSDSELPPGPEPEATVVDVEFMRTKNAM